VLSDVQVTVGDGTVRGTIHGRAMGFIETLARPGSCRAGLPDEIAGFARGQEMALFGRSDPIELPGEFPARYELP